jgi:hypothetical protein
MSEPLFTECRTCAYRGTHAITRKFRCSALANPIRMKRNRAINGLCRAVKPRKELGHVRNDAK